MKVCVSYVGTVEKHAEVVWPEGWPVPRVGDAFDLEAIGLPEVEEVRTVVWYPHGEDESDEPFVYVVVGPRRPR